MAIKITAAVPTYNRAGTLGATLASLAALKLPSGVELDCLVIDNASTDATAQVVESSASAAPFAMRRVLEPRPGSSFARNRAVAEATGEFVKQFVAPTNLDRHFIDDIDVLGGALKLIIEDQWD